MTKRTLSLVCIFLGIIILLYPTLNDRYESYQQQRILKQWQENLQHIDQAASETERISEVPSSIPVDGATVHSQPVALSAEPTTSVASMMQKNVEGVLIIDKINLKLPILKDATVDNMKLSVASIANTGKLGAVGNYAIAGHRNLTYGKNFNRLDEVAVGDMIEVDTGSKQYWYKVQDKLYVLPEDVWVLKGNGKDQEITLITCHPMENPTHRIIVKAKLVEK
ncbi:class D sortase [Paenibacillus sp. SYP-B3998]|uniref:Class D sortase n=1 Tax=Paenibacillus sp. SYP-B3998 TaxID=2678564 RepID=A0A6G4A0C0_9BACL|nr:class D sortase [Paenibacillus sp. SYP-B3998]NEW07738.1 class D sortase [Paenibacillus sp. SYP-B3998]